ncbi:unnamed protein product [Effrenium voratum]|nr:unnamed protein product [Effrenium voratum]
MVAKGAGLVNGENWAARCEPVKERQPPNHETQPRSCPISHIRERAEGDHQLSRVRGGLMPMSYPVNPERECKTVGMGRTEEPMFRTRSQLLETRKELMKRDNEDLRAMGDVYYVPLSIRNGEQDVVEHNFREAKGDPQTLTKLKDQRRKDKIEYDMNHFSFPRAFPRACAEDPSLHGVHILSVGSRQRSGGLECATGNAEDGERAHLQSHGGALRRRAQPKLRDPPRLGEASGSRQADEQAGGDRQQDGEALVHRHAGEGSGAEPAAAFRQHPGRSDWSERPGAPGLDVLPGAGAQRRAAAPGRGAEADGFNAEAQPALRGSERGATTDVFTRWSRWVLHGVLRRLPAPPGPNRQEQGPAHVCDLCRHEVAGPAARAGEAADPAGRAEGAQDLWHHQHDQTAAGGSDRGPQRRLPELGQLVCRPQLSELEDEAFATS